MTPLHYPEQYPEGPWGVESEGRSWYVCDRRTGRKKRIGPVGGKRVNWFDRAMEEAARRNKALVTQ